MSGNKHKMEFVPMLKIVKTATFRDLRCSNWVATEKIHGASFQFFTNDGINIHIASRRRVLDGEKSFQKCDLVEFHSRHCAHVKRLFSLVAGDSRWTVYTAGRSHDDDDDRDKDEGDLIGEGAKCCDLKIADNVGDGNHGNVDYVTTDQRVGTDVISSKHDIPTNETSADIELRVYGELYGGGGVHENVRSALQKEVIYSDEFRFYVFAISINRKWLNVTELNDLCKQAGFPYYATPVCEPKDTLEELVCWLTNSGFMKSKSRFTDKAGDANTSIEGVVMSPLTRQDYRRHNVKLLSSQFTDVIVEGTGTRQKINYCTKARYLSVMSKLDIEERRDVAMVTDLFIADVLEESGWKEMSKKKHKSIAKSVKTWLTADGYITKICY